MLNIYVLEFTLYQHHLRIYRKCLLFKWLLFTLCIELHDLIGFHIPVVYLEGTARHRDLQPNLGKNDSFMNKYLKSNRAKLLFQYLTN